MDNSDAPADFKRSRRRKGKPALNGEREQPHCLKSEAGVLGCIILSPVECIPRCLASIPHSGSFYDLKHRAVYESILSLHRSGVPIEVWTIQQHLRDNGELDDVGVPFIAELPDQTPSAANLDYYLSVVTERAALREAIRTAQDIAERAFDHGQADMAMFADGIEAALKRLVSVTRGAEGGEVGASKSFDELLLVDTDHDANCLLGVRQDGTMGRYLCRGAAGWIIGPSGIGKSSLAMLMAAHWSAGIPSLTIAPSRPLRITLIQAENDDGDMAEMVKGVASGLDDGYISEAGRELIRQNLRVRTENSKIGLDFTRWLERVIKADKADVVLLDPFLSFGGFDVSRQDQCSLFLRKWLNPVLHSTGCALIGMHHTGKPKQNQKGARPLTPLEQAYEGIGSSELVNWARLVMNLRECGGGICALTLTKRGDRAWATHPDGTPAETLWLRKGQGRIWWEQIAPPEESEPEEKPERKTKAEMVAAMNSASFLVLCKDDGESLRAITKRLANWSASKDAPEKISISQSTARGAIDMMLNSAKLERRGELYFRGENA